MDRERFVFTYLCVIDCRRHLTINLPKTKEEDNNNSNKKKTVVAN